MLAAGWDVMQAAVAWVHNRVPRTQGKPPPITSAHTHTYTQHHRHYHTHSRSDKCHKPRGLGAVAPWRRAAVLPYTQRPPMFPA